MIKKSTFIIQTIVMCLRLEGLFYYFSRIVPIFTKFIPLPERYNKKSNAVVIRDMVKFSLNRSDYMQWHIYAGLPDHSWRAASDYLSNESIIFDVGANVGAFSLKLAKTGINLGYKDFKIYAFEPNKSIVDALKKNLTLNPDISKSVEICNFALGNNNGYCSLDFNENNSGGGRITEKGSSKIPIKKIDTYVEEEKIANVSFMKIDVEGFEPEVINGAEYTIQNHKPALFIEMTDHWFRARNTSCNEIIEKLKCWGYELFLETTKGLSPLNHQEHILEKIPQYNILAKPSN